MLTYDLDMLEKKRSVNDYADIMKKIGNTTYRVKIHFSTTSKETMSDKIKRLIMNDCGKIS